MRDGPTGDLHTMFGAAGALTTATLPVFLLGALSGQVRDDLGIDEAGIGAVITVLFVTVGVVAGPVGRLTERVGAGVALRTGVTIAGLATATVGLVASSWWHLAAGFVVVALALAAIDTGVARTFADGVAPDRQGVAFGVKEASVPTASLLAGVALPTVGVVLGWRGAFVSALGVAVVALVLLPRRAASGARAPARRTPPGPTVDAPAVAGAPTADEARAGVPAVEGATRRRLWTFAIAVGLGAAGANAAVTFLAPAMAARGATPALAGATLVVASAASIGVRLTAGRWADRPSAPTVGATSLLLVVGAVGAALLALPVPTVVAVVAAVALLGGGWGWTGLAFLSAVRARADAPAAAAGVVLTGLGIGGAGGPAAFGAAASRASYGAAWTLTAVLLAAGAALSALSDRR